MVPEVGGSNPLAHPTDRFSWRRAALREVAEGALAAQADGALREARYSEAASAFASALFALYAATAALNPSATPVI